MGVSVQVLADDGSQKLEYLHCSHNAVHDGEWGEYMGLSEAQDHLHSFERIKLQVV